jgi:hypothetical protein
VIRLVIIIVVLLRAYFLRDFSLRSEQINAPKEAKR